MNKPPHPPITHTRIHTLHIHTEKQCWESSYLYKTAWQINAWFLNQGKRLFSVSLGFHLLSPLYLRHSHTHLNQTSPPPNNTRTHTHLLIKSEAVQLFCVCGYACNVSVWSVKTDLMDWCPQFSLIRLQQVSPMIDSSQVIRPSLSLLESGR